MQQEQSEFRESKILLLMPNEIRRRLKLLAAFENISLNKKILSYIKEGLDRETTKFEKIIEDIETSIS